MPKEKRILWIDDEIDLLRSHIMFLGEKGYTVRPAGSGDDGIAALRGERFDLILLDETMPGKSGLETLQEIKEIDANVPVVMITKNEAEDLVEQAIGMKIDDYLLKPVNPLQIYSAAKRILDAHRIQETALSREYLQAYQRVEDALRAGPDWRDWIRVHQELSAWDVEFDRFSETGLEQTQQDIRKKCNADFCRCVEQSYRDWISSAERPPLSVDVLERWVFPHLRERRRVYFIVIDCMRYDQWLKIEDLLAPLYAIERSCYYSILPTATPYARNALFAGAFPAEIQKRFPGYWLERTRDELSKNRFEQELLAEHLSRSGLGRANGKYIKIYEIEEANEIRKQADSYRSLDLVAMVFNFLDILAHGRSQSEILQEIAPDESAFRSLMRSWFVHSALFDILQKIARHGARVVITTDHGSILGARASLVHGNRDTSTNLRYKFGENINGDPRQTLLVKKPLEYQLPAESPAKNYLLAKENYYFVYPTKFHEYERQYHGTFQHGGISLEEMIVPCVTLTPRCVMIRLAPRCGQASAPPPRRRLEAFGAGRGRVAITTGSPADTLALGRALGEVLPPGAVLSLEGGLGAGKTLIAKGIGAGLGIADEITSPSFVLVEEYRGELPLLHVDLYRLERLEEVAGIGLFDAIDGRSIVVIEWGDRLPPGTLRIDVRIAMRVAGPAERAIEIEGPTELLALLPGGGNADGGGAVARSGGGWE